MALDLQMIRGRTALFSIAATHSLAGKALYFHAAVRGVVIDKDSVSSPAGITIDDETGGLATLQINPADTEGLPDVAPRAPKKIFRIRKPKKIFPLEYIPRK